MMKCDTCREMLTAYLQAGLEPPQAAEVEEHLATCAECARECEGARKVLARLDAASDEPLVRIATVIVERAVRDGASDIHIRMFEAGGSADDSGDVETEPMLQPDQAAEAVRHVKVFLRIDGVMHEAMRLPEYVHQPLIDRIKIMAGMSLAVREVPQEGRFQTEVGERKLDLRVSVVPTVAGPSLVIRLFDESGVNLTLDRVNLVGEQRAQLEKLIHAPQGAIFVSGPTGSGKTTTLYAILNELNSPERHIMSIENPVGYRLEGVTQISVNPQTGLDFKTAMRSVMMQDPDVIMCGEIRDLETLELCFQAAVWGHLVLTTVHTLDAVSALRRVLDVGADRFMVTEAFLGSTCQRLLRRICGTCKEEAAATEEELQWLREAGVTEVPEKLWRGRGCDQCKQTGHRGRAAAYEVFVMDEEIRGLLASGASLDDIEKAAAPKVKPMKQSAAAMVLAGEVDAAEAMRLLP